MYASLHTKSHYSLGDGCTPVDVLVERAAGLGYPALALTDVENLSGQVQFHHAARARGVAPITGVELRGGFGPADRGALQGRLLLLARDRRGYESLCRIVTTRRCTGFESSPDPLRCLEAFPSGLFYLSDDPEVIRRLLAEGVSTDEVRYLVADPDLPMLPGIRAVADADVVMLDPADRELRRLLAAIRRRCNVSDLDEETASGRPLLSLAEFGRRFAGRRDLLEESLALAEACTLDLTQAPPVLPTGDHPDQDSAHAALVELSRGRLPAGDGVRAERLTRELGTFRSLGLAGYFLVIAEIATHARTQGIRVAGVGPAAGSLVAHLLGLSEVDPVSHGLLFEPFLQPEQTDLPDVELEVAADRRDELLDWIFRRFGEGRVAMVAQLQTFGRRAAFRDGLKAFGMEPAGIDRFIQGFPSGELERSGPLPTRLLPERFHAVVPLIERMVGLARQCAVDSGGVVIAETRVDCYAPLERTPKGVPVTQYDTASLRRLGLIKLELRDNRALAAHAEARRLIGLPLDMPDGDPATVASLRAGNTIGCFEIEAPAIRGLLQQLPVRGISDLMAALAIARPGPGAGEARADYLRRANGETSREPPHPRLAQQLRDSHGTMLFDEDVVAALSALTGWPLGAAEELRRTLGTSTPGTPGRLALKRRFLVASSLAGVARGDGERVWRLLERFAGDSLSKSRAAGQARIAWEAAWLKTHHPLEFACGVLNSYSGHYPLRAIASDLVRCGVRLLAPHVNSSGIEHRLEGDAVRLGLCAVKYLTARHRDWIVKEQPWADLRSLVLRIPLTPPELEALILSGACDDLAPLSGSAYPFPHEELLTRWKREPGVRGLDRFVPRNARGQFAETYRRMARIRHELRFLGMHPSGHPIQLLRAEAEREGCVSTSGLRGKEGHYVRLAAMVVASRKQTDGAGRTMQSALLEDEHGLVEAILSPAVLVAASEPVQGTGPLLVSGWLDGGPASSILTVEAVAPLQLRAVPAGLVPSA
ncbi:MAG TPA: PHP domain-containing protein [Gemmatimonadales bacterium]